MEMERSQRKQTRLLLRVADWEGTGYDTSMCKVYWLTKFQVEDS